MMFSPMRKDGAACGHGGAFWKDRLAQPAQTSMEGAK